MNNPIGWAVLSMLVLTVLGLAGCALYLPAHRKSCDVRGERVSVRVLKWEEMSSDDLQQPWKDAFSPGMFRQPVEAAQAKVVAPVASAAASYVTGLAVDYVKRVMQAESNRYEAQFGKRVACDGFWKSNSGKKWLQEYYGIEVVRTTAKHTEPPSFKLVCGVGQSLDGALFRVVPLAYQRASTKAKILSYRWYSWLIPPFLHPLFMNAGSEVETTVGFEMDAFWVDGAGHLQSAKAGMFTIPLPPWDLDAVEMKAQKKNEIPRDQFYGPFGGIPVSAGIVPGESDKRVGAFDLKVMVTERDPSNARPYIDKGIEALNQNRDQIIERVVTVVTNKADKQQSGRSP